MIDPRPPAILLQAPMRCARMAFRRRGRSSGYRGPRRSQFAELVERYARRSCAFSRWTSSAAHSRASFIFPASRKARAFARAWLSADRWAGVSLSGGPAPLSGRPADDVLRIWCWFGATRFQSAANFDPKCFDRNVLSAPRGEQTRATEPYPPSVPRDRPRPAPPPPR
jgi:hypothetical protein